MFPIAKVKYQHNTNIVARTKNKNKKWLEYKNYFVDKYIYIYILNNVMFVLCRRLFDTTL